MEKNLVSVILPTYNRAEMLKEAINSVLIQTYKNFELIIIDDGSSDNTKEIVKSFSDDRIKYIWQENSGTPAGARNSGLKEAKGEYIAFLDSDDLWLPKKLEIQCEYLEKDPELLLIASNVIEFTKNLSKKREFVKENTKFSFKDIIKINDIRNSSVLLKREAYEKTGFLDTKLNSMEDYDYWLRVLRYRDYSAMILRDILIKFRFHEAHTYFGISLMDKYKKLKYIYYKHNDYEKVYIEGILRKKLYSTLILIKRKHLLMKKIHIIDLIAYRHLRIVDKLMIILKFINEKYLKSIFTSLLIKIQKAKI